MKTVNFFRKYHKWLGIAWAVFFVIYAMSGIVLNHRRLFAPVDVSRKILPQIYHYKNWNLSAVKSTLKLSSDSILIYGNIGVWLTDSTFSQFKDFNTGLPKGMDNRRILSMALWHRTPLAGTMFGLFQYDFSSNKWKKIPLPQKNVQIEKILPLGDSLLILTRSYVLTTDDLKHFRIITLKPAKGYDNKVGLFKTLWTIHTGEIYGNIGKLIVDLVGLIFTFLTITGLLIWLNKGKLQKRKKSSLQKAQRSVLWNRRWHNRIGWITIILLLITASTGMFLRPPFLIFIANSQVKKVPGTVLDSPNPWYDQLRAIIYDPYHKQFIIGTDKEFYYLHSLNDIPQKFDYQVPLSVMGINVFRQIDTSTYLVGSFEGLYLWNPYQKHIYDLIFKREVQPSFRQGRDDDYSTYGYTDDFPAGTVVFDYDRGAMPLDSTVSFVTMPPQIKNLPMSLWRVAQEFHTGRIFRPLLGGFYILIVPLTGLIAIFILISGFIVWWKIFRNNNKNNINNGNEKI